MKETKVSPSIELNPSLKTMKTFISSAIFILGTSIYAHGSGFSEPPAVLYGKVVHIDAGSTYEVTRGLMSVTLVSDTDATNEVTLTAELGPSGSNGQFSYRLDIPQQYLPSSSRKDDSLEVGEAPLKFRFSSISIDGVEASPIDTAQSLLTTSFSDRAQEHRLDLAVTLPQLDSDGDGMPDWWEEEHALNPLFAGDATSDEDSDGWDALTEFNNGSNPTVSNNSVTVESQKLIAPPASRLGLFFKVLDSSDLPADIQFTLTSLPAGVGIVNLQPSFRRLVINDTFSYADVLNGSLFFEAGVLGTPSASATVNFEVSDTETSNVPLSVEIVQWSPLEMEVQEPALWLSANTPPESDTPYLTLLDGWQDSTTANRNAYQPNAAKRPYPLNSLGGGGDTVAFGANTSGFLNESFMYLDDTNLNLSEFTLFCRLSPLIFRQFAIPDSEQSVLSLNDLQLGFAATSNPLASNSVVLRREGSTTFGHSLRSDESSIITATGSGKDATLDVAGQSTGRYASNSDGSTIAPVFSSIGARVPISSATPDQALFHGIGDILLYDQQLDPLVIARMQDYLFTSQGAVLWDFSTRASTVNLSIPPGWKAIILGGWGNDQLAGNNQPDILRGGPGADILTGNASGDTFQFFLDDGNDTITDFDAASGPNVDQLDLRGLLAGKSGLPEQYVNLRRITRHQAGQAPTIDTAVEINLEGDESGPEMVITLTGVHLENTDLPRLVGESIFLLGAPSYPVDFAIEATQNNLTETEFSRTITITRSGNVSTATQVVLGFTGSANAGTDYSLAQIVENETFRTLDFAAGETSKQFDLTPIQDILPESETIYIAVLPSPQVPELADSFLALTLDDAPEVKIETLVEHAQRLGQVPGVIKVSRTGDLSQPLDVRLSFDGSAENGEDFEQVSPLVSFNANEQSKTINITPANHAADKGAPKVATTSIVPDTTKYATLSPWSSSVMIFDKLAGAPKDYTSWRAGLPAQFNQEGALEGDADLINLYAEYVHGLDATVADNPNDISINVFTLDGRFVMEVPTNTGLSDVRIFPEAVNGGGNTDVSDLFEHDLYPVSDDRIMHVFTSRQAVTEFGAGGIFRLQFSPVQPPSTLSSASTLLGTGNQPYLTSGSQSGWTAASNGQGLAASPRASGETTSFQTTITGTAPVSFDWEVPAGSGATLTFFIDGVQSATLTDGQAAATVNATPTGSGEHQLKWTMTYGVPTTGNLGHHGLIKNVTLAP